MIFVSQPHDGADLKVASQLHSRSVLVEIGGAGGHGKRTLQAIFSGTAQV
jgi:hypothetical protein